MVGAPRSRGRAYDRPPERLDAMVRFFCKAFDAEPDLFAFLLLNQNGPARSFSAKAANPLKVIEAELERAAARREILPGDLKTRALVIMGAVLQPAAAYSRQGKTGLAEVAEEIAGAAARAAGFTYRGGDEGRESDRRRLRPAHAPPRLPRPHGCAISGDLERQRPQDGRHPDRDRWRRERGPRRLLRGFGRRRLHPPLPPCSPGGRGRLPTGFPGAGSSSGRSRPRFRRCCWPSRHS